MTSSWIDAEIEPLVNPFKSTKYDAQSRSDCARQSVIDGVLTRAKWLTSLCWIILSVLAVSGVWLFFSHRYPGTSTHPVASMNRIRMEETHAAIVPAKWSESAECQSDHAFTLTLALKETNMDKLDEHVMAVSDPARADTFRQFWTSDDVRAYFAPSAETLDTVFSWLADHGLTEDNGLVRRRSIYGNLVHVDITCGAANDLLGAKYMVYEHADTHKSALRVADGLYSVPESVSAHIDVISPTIRFPPRQHSKELKPLDLTADQMAQLNSIRAAKALTAGDSDDQVDADDELFEGYNTPPRLYSLYGLDKGFDDILSVMSADDTDSISVAQAIVSYDEEYYLDSDLQLAWDTMGYAGLNELSEMVRVPSTQAQGTGAEAELDTQYITATGPGIETQVFYISGEDDDYFSGLVEDVLAADVVPSVVSISYGADEYEWGEAYCKRANEAFGKLALIGVTVFASSGDSGALGNDDDCVDGVEYVASFPASATYVTAVGGTIGGDEDAVGTTDEQAWFYSGGGFSTFFEEPSWQSSAVANYFSQSITYPSTDAYTSGMRGFPDISAQSVYYVIAYDGAFYEVSGTSCSSPAVAGMVSMMNVQRAQEGKASLGFLNPSLYAIYDAQSDYDESFNDVTAGFNEGCSDDVDEAAWYAADGWDPVTGCGTPKFDVLLAQLSALD